MGGARNPGCILLSPACLTCMMRGGGIHICYSLFMIINCQEISSQQVRETKEESWNWVTSGQMHRTHGNFI